MKLLSFLMLMFLTKILYAQPFQTDTTFVVGKNEFRIGTQYFEDEYYTKVFIYKNGHLITHDSCNYFWPNGPDFVDFNKDGNVDFILTALGNVSVSTLYLYDTINESFCSIKHFDKFPNANKVPNTFNYYYSYHRSGCADMIWDSDLFQITGGEAKLIANIHGDGCDSASNEILITKSVNHQNSIIDKLPISVIDTCKDYKWGFIKEYWTKNIASIIHSGL